MAKQPRTQLSGKEARYILKQNSVNLSWLAEQLNILLASHLCNTDSTWAYLSKH